MISASRQTQGGGSSEAGRLIPLGGAILGTHRHICAFLNRHDDQYGVLLPFIKDGFECGEKAVHIIDPQRRDEHVRRLLTAGIDASAAQQAGQLDLREWSEAPLRGGSFDQRRTLELIDDIRERSKQQGFRRIRFVTHMEWALEDRPGVDGLLEYEASANLVPFEDPVICADVVAEVMRTYSVILDDKHADRLQAVPAAETEDHILLDLEDVTLVSMKRSTFSLASKPWGFGS